MYVYYAHLNRVTSVFLSIWQHAAFYAIQLNNFEKQLWCVLFPVCTGLWEKVAIKNMCTNHSKHMQHEPKHRICHHTLHCLWLIQRTTWLLNGCCQRWICPGLKPRLPAATRAVRSQVDVAARDRARTGITKEPYKRLECITDVSHTQQRQYRCIMDNQVHILAPVLPAA